MALFDAIWYYLMLYGIIFHLLSDQQISYTLQSAFLTAFEDFAQYILPLIGGNPATAQVPIKVRKDHTV